MFMNRLIVENSDLKKIMKNEAYVSQIKPAIIEFIRNRYGSDVKCKIDNKGIYFGQEDYRGIGIEIKLYVENQNLKPIEVKRDVFKDLKNFFNINMAEYGSCASLSVYEKKWEKI